MGYYIHLEIHTCGESLQEFILEFMQAEFCHNLKNINFVNRPKYDIPTMEIEMNLKCDKTNEKQRLEQVLKFLSESYPSGSYKMVI